jgi:hypothetical protein
MAQSLFRQQLKAAWLPTITFSICAILVVINHPPSGSLAVREGEYSLVFKHGYYQIISKEQYEEIKRQQQLLLVCGAGMLLSVLGAVILIKRAGLRMS